MKYETRVGIGFDVHQICEAKSNDNNRMVICGVGVPCDKSLKGHSDADVGIHAIVDAIFGAIGAGDIGEHFPPSDDKFKDMDSSIFLEYAGNMVKDKEGKIVNIDVTIICESPRMSPYKREMEKRLAEILLIEQSRVNVKATTTEKLGFTGRGEGIAAQSVVSIKLPIDHKLDFE